MDSPGHSIVEDNVIGGASWLGSVLASVLLGIVSIFIYYFAIDFEEMPKKCAVCGVAQGKKKYSTSAWGKPDGTGTCAKCGKGKRRDEIKIAWQQHNLVHSRKIDGGHLGIENQGNTCYMNSLLQTV